jgi:hypothetical protein
MSGPIEPDADAALPRPDRVRLVRGLGSAQGEKERGRPPPPPFGLRAWSQDEDAAIVVLLELPRDWAPPDLGPIARQMPAADAVAGGRLVVVLECAGRTGGVVSRLLLPRTKVALAVRGSALLSQGYERIGAAVDRASGEQLVWGYAPAMR